MEAYADPLQYFEPDPTNDVKPQEVASALNHFTSCCNTEHQGAGKTAKE